MSERSFSSQLGAMLAHVPLETPKASALGAMLAELGHSPARREASGPPVWLALAATIAMFALVFALRPRIETAPEQDQALVQQRALIEQSQMLEGWLRANGSSEFASADLQTMLENVDAQLSATDSRDPASLVLWETRVALLSAQVRQQSDGMLASAVQAAWEPDLL